MAALFGLDGPKNGKEAAKWFRKAAERGYGEAKLALQKFQE